MLYTFSVAPAAVVAVATTVMTPAYQFAPPRHLASIAAPSGNTDAADDVAAVGHADVEEERTLGRPQSPLGGRDRHGERQVGLASTNNNALPPQTRHATQSNSKLDDYYTPELADMVTAWAKDDLLHFGYRQWNGVNASAYLADAWVPR